jgi:hypothetical protein
MNVATIILIRPHRGGWQCFEGPGVEPYWIGDRAKEQALNYAQGRVSMRRGEIQIFNAAGELEKTIPFDQSGRRVSDA